MTVIISDTGPLNYLILIEEIELLPRLFAEVVVPYPVLIELQHERTPAEVRTWVEVLPAWITVERPGSSALPLQWQEKLGQGEVSAMTLAMARNLPVLMDDREARQVAKRLGLTTFGTLAILEAAAMRGWIAFRPVAERLRAKGFYVTEAIIDEIAQRSIGGQRFRKALLRFP